MNESTQKISPEAAAQAAQEALQAKYHKQNKNNEPVVLKKPFKNGAGERVTQLPSPKSLKVKQIRKAQKMADGCSIDAELYSIAAAYQMTFEDLGEVDGIDYDVMRGRFLALGTTDVDNSADQEYVEPDS